MNEKGEQTQRYYETLMLPISRIGSKTDAVKASVDELVIFDRVLNENEIVERAVIQVSVNLALNKPVTVGNYHSAITGGNRSGSKVVDGDLASRWEFDLNNTDTNYIEVPLNDNERAVTSKKISQKIVRYFKFVSYEFSKGYIILTI